MRRTVPPLARIAPSTLSTRNGMSGENTSMISGLSLARRPPEVDRVLGRVALPEPRIALAEVELDPLGRIGREILGVGRH